ncbi:MAG TPA: hypothetical protein VGI63_07175 [Verrucomicrobiae bacterium]|jgi:hypothetical protein
MNASPNDSPTLFIDRNSGGRSFHNLLIERGLKIVLHDEEFPQTAADEDWVMSVGERGWVVVTGDNATTSSPLFLLRLSKSKAFVFILHALNGVSATDKAGCILKAYKTIKRLVGEHQPPAIWRIGKDGVAREFDFQKVLVKMHRRQRS